MTYSKHSVSKHNVEWFAQNDRNTKYVKYIHTAIFFVKRGMLFFEAWMIEALTLKYTITLFFGLSTSDVNSANL